MIQLILIRPPISTQAIFTRLTKNKANFFFFNDTAPTKIYTLSLHDALPICDALGGERLIGMVQPNEPQQDNRGGGADRKSTRLNSSHVEISYAVFCLKK